MLANRSCVTPVIQEESKGDEQRGNPGPQVRLQKFYVNLPVAWVPICGVSQVEYAYESHNEAVRN